VNKKTTEEIDEKHFVDMAFKIMDHADISLIQQTLRYTRATLSLALEQNKELEAVVEKLESRIAELERDISIMEQANEHR